MTASLFIYFSCLLFLAPMGLGSVTQHIALGTFVLYAIYRGAFYKINKIVFFVSMSMISGFVSLYSVHSWIIFTILLSFFSNLLYSAQLVNILNTAITPPLILYTLINVVQTFDPNLYWTSNQFIGYSGNPNNTVVNIVLMYVITLFHLGFGRKKSIKIKLFWLMMALVSLYVIILCGSRAGLVSALVASAYVLFVASKFVFTVTVFIVGVAFSYFYNAFYLSDVKVLERLMSTVSIFRPQWREFVNLWIADRGGFWGYGLKNFSPTGATMPTDNSWLAALISGGIVYFTVFTYWTVIAPVSKLRFFMHDDNTRFAQFLFCALLPLHFYSNTLVTYNDALFSVSWLTILYLINPSREKSIRGL